MVAMAIVILILSFVIRIQKETTSQYKNNDLKYRYIKMQGKINEEGLYRLERQFEYKDSIVIVRKQVEKYERLVKEQAEKIERAKLSAKEMEELQKEVEDVKGKK
jgi:hypothetical protein